MLSIFVESHDLHGNVASERILFELAQNGPTQHVRQENIEGDRGRLELPSKGKRVGFP